MSDLKDIDPESRTWRAVKAWAEQRIEQHRQRLEMRGLPAAETEHARGAIAEARLLASLPEQARRTETMASALIAGDIE